MIAAADIRAELSAAIVIREYGLRAIRRGSQFRLKMCPRCGEKSPREAIAIDARTGSWLHFGSERASGGSCSGDVLDLIAACEGLDCRRDFRRIAERAASLAGIVGLDETERAVRRAEAERRAAEADEEERLSYEESRRLAVSSWALLPRHSIEGSDYLRRRGISAARAWARFPGNGVAVAIHDPEGVPTSIATRQYVGEPKVLALKGSKTRGTMIDSVSEIDGRDVIVTEGVIDSLTARIAWPNAIVLGANGAGKIKEVVMSLLSRATLARSRLLLIPHDDEQGVRATAGAAAVAIAAGFELGSTLNLLSLPAKDLNDAWCAGWRP